jgi:electron-transferring-flavoprotein dehydrogenase
MADRIVPLRYQASLPQDRLIVTDAPDAEAVPMDVVFVGGGPAGLAGAIALAKLVREDNEKGGGIGEIEIAVLEKAESLGEHCLSGAIIKPGPFQDLFPDVAIADMPFRSPVQG